MMKYSQERTNYLKLGLERCNFKYGFKWSEIGGNTAAKFAASVKAASNHSLHALSVVNFGIPARRR